MVDTLDDDWWHGTGSSVDAAEVEPKEKEVPVNIKRSSELPEEVANPSPRPKKRHKRIKITDKLANKEDIPATLADFNNWLNKCGKGTLSTVEVEDLYLTEKSTLDDNASRSGLSDYLRGVIPNWKSLVETDATDKQTCTLMVVTSSGRRAVELNRDAAQFRGKCSTAKLFAKHIKLKDQIALLSKRKVDFAVGTPNRIASIIAEGALDVSKTLFIILDWNWRDVKLRRMIDMPELEKDLFALLKNHFIPVLQRNKKIKIGLF